MAEVVYASASRVYPGSTPVRAVDRLDLEVADGEFLVLVGPSGSGKSTALRMLAGLEDVNEGDIRIGERTVTGLPPKDRDIAMVFQSYALYPHMTVAENMGFALKLRGMPKDEIRAKVTEAAGMLDLGKYLDRKPKALSGGQRQRVAMGRAIVREPSVFLMDEPLSNLDAKLRVETRANIAGLQRRLGTTTLYVTHDQVEAMTMGDRVAVLKDGLLQQCASPRELYDHPANSFVAGFIGSPSMNLLEVTPGTDGIELGGLTVPLPREVAAEAGDLSRVVFGVRPECLRPAGEGEAGFDLTVELVEELGADGYVHGSLSLGGEEKRVVVRVDGRVPPRLGERLRVTLRDFDEVHFFHPETTLRIGG
ncbi:carbohydrate ABC transporter ATP-binding protein (CUT1 family) [Saccharopolyspora erythraea NRRL 2338]|uniref:Sugar ABC transporter, ATP-binding protein n=2 Tax=Saccharopolyspora erythraea TaxID=1836 RepID=A4FHA3_SACEN|nr:sn-glycerol-3-phosphate ABC transporter ATP-binding protein UgpC [Saccharopolyspora erythraea]EQD86836.1 sugar ABC transporter ATP-binding protein [Saccharopolyspora erythraea D]PFG97128.1 carbohydrate ABC transporter ATP-binding protein (CUT1 family) [Saccharopolyspora erythraea NRRL 2338]QRK87331.1 sn-glycerol-3-phosphate ABC transporter ATP-binding protein UgpC [Saccharopolyspora erythraea]CAM03428.1 sugar ABC transporter, ATP-binding protein [Saccharopolyspora erythraea NRRL 2338]